MLFTHFQVFRSDPDVFSFNRTRNDTYNVPDRLFCYIFQIVQDINTNFQESETNVSDEF